MEIVGNGSVIKREDKPRSKCRKWELSVMLRGGRRKTRAFHGTWLQACDALESLKAEIIGTFEPSGSGITFAEYSAMWLVGRGGKVSPKTARTDASRIRFLCREFGDMEVSKIDGDAVGNAISSWSAEYAPTTIRQRLSTLKTVMGSAIADGLASADPTDGLIPKRTQKRDHVILSNEQMDYLASVLDPSQPHQLAVMICLGCGLRIGEAVALMWHDWDGESIHVERAEDGIGGFKEPKTAAGIRSIPAPWWLADALDSQAGEGRMFGFTSSALGMWWSGHRHEYGVSCTMHELRHSYLTRLARAGVHPRVMMALAGHDSIDVCMEIYTHVSGDMQRDAVRRAFG